MRDLGPHCRPVGRTQVDERRSGTINGPPLGFARWRRLVFDLDVFLVVDYFQNELARCGGHAVRD